MKITYLSTAVITSQYANSVQVMKMCEALAQNGATVHLVGLQGEWCDDPYRFYDVNPLFSIENIKTGWLCLWRRIYSALTIPSGVDVVITRSPLIAFMSGILRRKTTVLEHHAMLEGGIDSCLEKILAKNKRVKHVFITNSLQRAYLSEYSKHDEKNDIVLPDGASIQSSMPEHQAGIGDSQGHLKCGYLGSFQKGKGVELVIEIANLMPNTEFHIIGGKPSEINEFKRTTKYSNVVWHGFKPQREAMEILSANVDIALLPNQQKVVLANSGGRDIGKYTSPMKLFEYMAYGKTIVASDLPVLREVLDENVAMLVDPNDSQQWANAIEELDKNREQYEKLRNRAWNMVRDKYSWKKRAASLIEFMNK